MVPYSSQSLAGFLEQQKTIWGDHTLFPADSGAVRAPFRESLSRETGKPTYKNRTLARSELTRYATVRLIGGHHGSSEVGFIVRYQAPHKLNSPHLHLGPPGYGHLR